MTRFLGLRNVLLMVGAYYVSAWVLVPLWIPFTRLVEGRVYHPGWESFWVELFNMIPVAIGAVLAGITIGYFLETTRPLVWALVVGLFVGLCNWSSTHWYVKPAASDLIAQAGKAFATAALAFAACWLVERRRPTVARRDVPA